MFNSLLWLDDSKFVTIEDSVIKDLNLDSIYKTLIALSEDNQAILNRLCIDEDTISYRQSIINDLMSLPGLSDELGFGLSEFTKLVHQFRYRKELSRSSNLYFLVDLVVIVEWSAKCVEQLGETLNYYQVQSQGLLDLKNRVNDQLQSKYFQEMKKDLKDIRHAFSNIKSAEITINLNPGMRPYEAMVTKLLEHPCKYPEAFRNVAMTFAEDGNFLGRHLTQYAPVFKIQKLDFDIQEELEFGLSGYNSILLHFLKTYEKVDPEPFIKLYAELLFYQSSVDLLNQLTKAQLPLCLPTIIDKDRKLMRLEGFYNLHLSQVLDINHVVLNDFKMGEGSGELFVLTGANSGGKTTFTQAVGQVQLLAQLGLMVPARSATLSIVTGVFTHFPVMEAATIELGRLGKECQDFSTLFSQADEHSLILMNESFSSTSHLESLLIATEAIKATKFKSCRMIFNTHLHELYDQVVEFNGSIENNCRIVSIISGSKENISSYLVSLGEPLGKSHALEVAMRYGVTYDQLMKGLEV